MDRSELRRLEKAARDKNKDKLLEWGEQFEEQVNNYYRGVYEKIYQQEVQNTLDNFSVALAYTLAYSEETKLNSNKLDSFMQDLYATVNMYKTGECNPNDFREELEKENVHFSNYDASAVYKERDKQLLKLIEEYTNLINAFNSNKTAL